MGAIESELGAALGGKVKRKGNATKKLRAIRAQAKGVASGLSTEVMVKITGFGKGGGHVKAHLEYVTRNGKLELENDRGEVFSGRDEVKDFFKDWDKDFGDGRRRKNQRDTMHMILSMPENTEPEAVKSAVREFAKTTFGKNHEYVFALHTDEPHPHCHLTVKCRGFDGVQLNPRKADLQSWREIFAKKLCDEGVNAEATPRQSRGVVKKAEASVIRHIERGDKTHEPRVSKVRAEKVREAAKELSAALNGEPAELKPWDVAIKAKQAEIRRAWLSAAAALEQEDTKKTFNSKGVKNDRPDYKRISADSVRPGQRAAALYQSNIERIGRKASPQAFAGLRNLSGLGLVQHRSSSQVLLQPNALDRLGGGGRSNFEVRRQGVGVDSPSRSEKQLGGYKATAEQNRELAGQIKGFVAAMPAVMTERQEMKADLMRKFSMQRDQRQLAPAVAPTPENSAQKNGADVAAPSNVDKGIER